MTQTLKALFLASFLGLSLTGCVYKIDVQQGNIITNKDVAKIHPGMTDVAVEQMLGAPLLRNVYRTNGKYYVYTMKQGHKPMYRRNLTIYFSKYGKVTRYTTDFAKDDHGKR
jgi:outer membrane protein assembly factor BamE